MDIRMPRGAFPASRSELSASEPYEPTPDAEVKGPSGAIPSPNAELASARPYNSGETAPQTYVSWPVELPPWDNNTPESSWWAEEAFAKACAEPKVAIPPDVVTLAAHRCGKSNFSHYMQTVGFRLEGRSYLDGPFLAVNWNNPQVLNQAISLAGPVKVGFDGAALQRGHHGGVEPGKGGWTAFGVPPSEPGSLCASLFGYGLLPELIQMFAERGLAVVFPSDAPGGLWYAMFALGSVGLIDRQSVLNLTSEAWVRMPTTVPRE